MLLGSDLQLFMIFSQARAAGPYTDASVASLLLLLLWSLLYASFIFLGKLLN